MHATCLVKPEVPDAEIKFFAAEALRGVGGLVFDAVGMRSHMSWQGETTWREKCGRAYRLSASL